MKEMYDDPQHVEVTFNRQTMPQYLLQAQFAELIELKKVIYELNKQHKGAPLRILDIGIGDARIIEHLIGIKEIREAIDSYLGIDIAQNCIDTSNTIISELHAENKVSTMLLDATKLDSIQKEFDLIITTRFTAGNFYPTTYAPEQFAPGVYDMTTNDKFTAIFQKAYEKLTPGGEIIIGSMYIDNEPTRKKQEEAYRYFGRDVITDEKDCFTATANGRRSQRFTKKRVYEYLPFIPKENISFIPLDTYEYAMMVRIKK